MARPARPLAELRSFEPSPSAGARAMSAIIPIAIPATPSRCALGSLIPTNSCMLPRSAASRNATTHQKNEV